MSLAVWCAVLLLGGAASAPAPGLAPASPLAPISLQNIDPQQLDDEALSYLLGGGGGGGGGRYAPVAAAGWRGVLDPGLYVINDLPHYQSYDWQRQKRKMPSLSISNPMEVLRQRLVLEIARKQMREHAARQAAENRLFLQNVGKRGMWGEGEGVIDAMDTRDDN